MLSHVLKQFKMVVGIRHLAISYKVCVDSFYQTNRKFLRINFVKQSLRLYHLLNLRYAFAISVTLQHSLQYTPDKHRNLGQITLEEPTSLRILTYVTQGITWKNVVVAC